VLVVAVYDVADEKRRAKISRVLEAYGTRVQKSVFECDLDNSEFERMRERLRKLVHEGDGMRYYLLCAACLQRVVVDAGPPVSRAQLWFVI